MEKIFVRPALEQDEVSWRSLYRQYRTFYDMPDDESQVSIVWEWVLDPIHELNSLVALGDNGEIVGLANHRRFSRPLSATMGLYLDDLFTDPLHRGRGVGTALLRALKQSADDQGFSVVRWITAESNTAAQRLYDEHATKTEWVTYDMT